MKTINRVSQDETRGRSSDPEQRRRWRLTRARWAGIVLQATVLGILLFIAAGKLIAMESGARLFRYQAF